MIHLCKIHVSLRRKNMVIKIVPIVPISALTRSVMNVKIQVPYASRQMLGNASKVFIDTAKKNIHTITGKSRASIQVQSVSDNEVGIIMRYGAVYEIRRSGSKPPPRQGRGTGPHNFLIASRSALANAMPKIITKEINSLFQKNRV